MKETNKKTNRNKDKLCIIGHFGGTKNIVDGQTVKTRELYDGLNRENQWRITTVDTHYKEKKPIRLVAKSIISILSNKKIIVLLSRNGMKIYFPILYLASKIARKDIFHDAIGGNLDKYVRENKNYIKYLNSFKCNIVETNMLKKRLEECGITNCVVVPNFKNLEIRKSNIKKRINKPVRLCTFSRVTKDKGIACAIEAVNEINKERANSAQLDIYGPIDDKYEQSFRQLLANNNKYVKYKGVVQYDKSVDTLSKYDMLLFPTHWEGEGFPGTIIDAFAAGLPVIASDWNYNKEIVENYKTGVIYPNKNEKNLKEAIMKIADNEKQYIIISSNCVKEAEKYLPKDNIRKICNMIIEP